VEEIERRMSSTSSSWRLSDIINTAAAAANSNNNNNNNADDDIGEYIEKKSKILVVGAGGIGCELLKDLVGLLICL
jgi:hypothetical protein